MGFGSGFIALQKLLKISVSDLVGARVCQAWYHLTFLLFSLGWYQGQYDCTFLTALVGISKGACLGTAMLHPWDTHFLGFKNGFLTQLEVPYYKCQFKIVAKTSDGLGMSKRFELDCSASTDR